jgi:hypothetical protein
MMMSMNRQEESSNVLNESPIRSTKMSPCQNQPYTVTSPILSADPEIERRKVNEINNLIYFQYDETDQGFVD